MIRLQQHMGLVGVYRHPPIGNRSLLNVGGDLGIVTEAGLISVRQLIAGGQEAAEKRAVSDKVDTGITSAFLSYGGLSGWQIMSSPRYTLAFLNIPCRLPNPSSTC